MEVPPARRPEAAAELPVRGPAGRRGFLPGPAPFAYYDFSSEFADYRPYTPGDEIRAIDWRALARTDRYYIKLYRKETDMNCYLLVDKSNSMGYRGDEPLTKLEYASYLAAALAY